MEKARIFISYKRKNKDQVFSIVNKIETQLGVKCWVDLDGIESSAQFASKICKAIDTAEVVLFMHSSVHLDIDFEEDWTIKELNYAHAKKKRVVLVKLDNAPLDNIFLMEYGSKNNIDSLDETQFQKLLKDLKAWLKTPEQSPKDTSKASRILGNKYETKFQTFYHEDGKKEYEGETKNGLYHGQGIYYFTDGSKYIGQFVDHEFHGQGTLYYIDGDKYEGQFEDSSCNGQGTLYFANGDKYVGEFENNEFNGQGILYYADGHKYVGQFKEGKKHGEGTIYYTNGDKSVTYDNDILIEQNIKHHETSADTEYDKQQVGKELLNIINSIKNKKLESKDKETIYFPNGDRFEGKYEDGKYSYGTFYYVNGDKYKGEFKNG